jgi:hypothetical protein
MTEPLTQPVNPEDLPRAEAFTRETQTKIDRCSADGGGLVEIPAGIHYTTGLRLRTGVTLHLGPATVLKAWPAITETTPRARVGSRRKPCLILTEDCEHCGLSGPGVLDGNGYAFWDPPLRQLGKDPEELGLGSWWEQDSPFWREKAERLSPLVEFHNCRDVRVQDITIRNSPGWTLHLTGCERCWVERVIIDNPLYGPNTDGLDINGCRSVHVHGCDITCGDDAIILKAFEEAGPCEQITVSQCRLATHCAALGIGAEIHHPIRDVVFTACVVPKALRILQIELWTPGLVENVSVSHIVGANITDIPLERVAYIDVQHHRREDGTLGHVRNVTVSDIQARTRGRILLTAADGATIEDVTLRDLRLLVDELEDPEVSVPESRSSQMSNDNPETRAMRALLVADNVRRLVVDNLDVRWPDQQRRHPQSNDPARSAREMSAEGQYGADQYAENGFDGDQRKRKAVYGNVPMALFGLRRCQGVRLSAPFAEPFAGAPRRLESDSLDVFESGHP